MVSRGFVAVGLALLLAGCTNPIDSPSGATHCHAEHQTLLDDHGDPARYITSSGPQGGYEAYRWGVERTNGCVSGVHVAFDAVVATDTRGCSGVDFAASDFQGTVVLAGAEHAVKPTRSDQGNLTEWSFAGSFPYEASVAKDQPAAWNATFSLLVKYEDTFLIQFVDDCVHRAVRHVAINGTDYDYKP
jgi:hypothetical protein